MISDNSVIEHESDMPKRVIDGTKAIDLWERWWNYTRGDPWVADTTDYGLDNSCYFCDCYRGEDHEDDCIYVMVVEMLGKELVA